MVETQETQPLTVIVETHPGPHRWLVAFFLFDQYLWLPMQANGDRYGHTRNHASCSPTSTFASTATGAPATRPAREVQTCCAWLNRSALSFQGFAPLRGMRRNVPFIEQLLWAKHYTHCLIYSSNNSERWFITPIRFLGKPRLEEIKLHCVSPEKQNIDNIYRKR